MTPSDLKKEKQKMKKKKHGNEPSAASGCAPTLRVRYGTGTIGTAVLRIRIRDPVPF